MRFWNLLKIYYYTEFTKNAVLCKLYGGCNKVMAVLESPQITDLSLAPNHPFMPIWGSIFRENNDFWEFSKFCVFMAGRWQVTHQSDQTDLGILTYNELDHSLSVRQPASVPESTNFKYNHHCGAGKKAG
jgi:hypothetical protein